MRFRLNLTHRNCHNSLIFLGRVIDLAGSPPEWGAVKEQVAADNKEQASLDQVCGGAAKEHVQVGREKAGPSDEEQALEGGQEQAGVATGLAGSQSERGACKEQVAAVNKEQARTDQAGGGGAKEQGAAAKQEQAWYRDLVDSNPSSAEEQAAAVSQVQAGQDLIDDGEAAEEQATASRKE